MGYRMTSQSEARRAYVVSKSTVSAIAKREAAKAGSGPVSADTLTARHNRDELVRLADARGLSTEGTKAELAKSIADFDRK